MGHTQLLRATDHLENCIDAVSRTEGFLETQAFKDATTPAQREMLLALCGGVHALRNSIQHAEARLASEGRVREGEPLFPALMSGGVYFAGDHLFYGELAGLVIHVWQLAAAGIEAAEP